MRTRKLSLLKEKIRLTKAMIKILAEKGGCEKAKKFELVCHHRW